MDVVRGGWVCVGNGFFGGLMGGVGEGEVSGEEV